MKILNLVFVLSLSVLAGCASQTSLENTRGDIDSIKSRMFSMDRDIMSARDAAKQSAENADKNLKAEVATVRKIAADIQASIDNTKSDMQAMNGKADDASVAARKASEDLARYREDADKRIVAMEERILKQQALLDTLTKKVVEPPPTSDSLYTKALETLKAGNAVAAREQFTKFLELNPAHELAANAHYWIGETHFSEKNYEPAILSYQEVIKNYPGKDKVVAAMLKQAMAFEAINDSQNSKFVLKKLIEGFPKSEEAKKAKALLKETK